MISQIRTDKIRVHKNTAAASTPAALPAVGKPARFSQRLTRIKRRWALASALLEQAHHALTVLADTIDEDRDGDVLEHWFYLCTIGHLKRDHAEAVEEVQFDLYHVREDMRGLAWNVKVALGVLRSHSPARGNDVEAFRLRLDSVR